VTVASVIVCLPLLKYFWFENHDMGAYPIRAIEYVRGWRAGYVFPRWAPDLYGGYGSPIFNYYAPGLFFIAGMFMLLGASATIALKLTVLAFTIAGGLGVLSLILGETKRLDAATLAAVVFVAMPYRFTQIYTRGDLAEYAAFAMIPVSLWSYRSLLRAKERVVARWALAAAVLQCAVLLIHTLTGLFYTEILLVLLTVWAVQRWRGGNRKRAATAGATFLAANGLCSFYAIPAILERGAVQIERMTGGKFDPAKNVVEPLALVSAGKFGAFFYVGLPILAVCLLAPAVLAVRRHQASRGELLRYLLLTIVLVAVMFKLAAPIWHVLPFGAFIQFPWRMLGFVAVSGAITAGWVWTLGVSAFDRRLLLPLLILCACVLLDGMRARPPIHPVSEDKIPATGESIARGIHTTVVSDEYLPVGATRPVAHRTHYVEPADRALHPGLCVQHGIGYRLAINADAPGDLGVLVFWFPGWRVITKSGPAKATLSPTPSGVMAVHLPAAGTYDLSIEFGLTALRLAATILTWLVLILFIVYLGRAHGWRAS